MKKSQESRFQNSQTLFRFCKQALEYQSEKKRVNDQEVGAILGFDPADCSHWKNGKKRIRALATLRAIADHLSLDEELLIDIVSGKIGLEEAMFEYCGYGQFSPPVLMQASSSSSRVTIAGIHEQYSPKPDSESGGIDRRALDHLVDVLVETDTIEAPIYLPEIYRKVSDIQLVCDTLCEKPVCSRYQGEGSTLTATIFFRGPELRPFMRFLIARELFLFLYHANHELVLPFGRMSEDLLSIYANLFAVRLLVPTQFLHKEIARIDLSHDFAAQLASVFWVSKVLINHRLRDFFAVGS